MTIPPSNIKNGAPYSHTGGAFFYSVVKQRRPIALPQLVMAGLVPAVSLHSARLCLTKRYRRAKPGDDTYIVVLATHMRPRHL